MDDSLDEVGKRGLLGAFGTVAMVGLAGCSSFGGPRTETGHSGRVTIRLDNADDTPRPYEVEVDWGDNNRSLFSGVLAAGATDSEMIAVTGTADDSASFRIRTTDATRSGTWTPTECPDYLVDGVVEDGAPSVTTSCRS